MGESTADTPRSTDLETVLQTGVMDPDVFARHLGGMALLGSNGEAVRAADVRVHGLLRHHAGKRCTLEIAVRTGDDWRLLIAKIYRKDRSDVFQALKGIQQSGFGPQDEYSISQPVGYVPSLRCVLQEKVDGTAAHEIILSGDEPARAAAAERCALWLARFHALAPKIGPITDSKEFVHSKRMHRWSRDVGRGQGSFGEKAARLLDQVNGASASVSDAELRAGQGSYTASHVLLSADRTAVIDWDRHDVADPARDVARFLYALRRWALEQLDSIRALDRVADVFLNTYLAAGGPVEKNLPFFEAVTCLNLAVRHLFDGGPWEEDKAEAMLDEGLRILEGRATV